MNINNIDRLVVYNDKDNKPIQLFIYNKDGSYTVEAYDEESEQIAKDFLASKGMTLQDAMAKGLISVYFAKFEDVFSHNDSDVDENDIVITPEEQELTDEEIDELLDENIPEEELEDVQRDGLSRKEKLGIIAAVLGVSVAAAVIITACSKQQKADKTNTENTNEISNDFDKASFKELMDEFAEDNERREFSENVYDTVEKLNNLCLDKSVFALEEDKDAVLQFSTDEVIAAKLVLNNYDIKDLKEIFGTKELSVKKLLSNYESFATKMMYYSMNAKAPSGVSTLIESEANRQFFEDIENSIINFNKDVNSKNADIVIKTFAYYYSHGIDGVNGISEDLESITGVQNLCLNMISGYYDANVEKDYSKYLVVSSEPNNGDSEFRNVRMAQLQKGSKLKFYKDLEENGNCTIQDVKEHLKEMISRHNLVIINMAEDLVDAGKTEDAEALLSGEEKGVPTFEQIKNAMDKELGPFIEIMDDVLYGNRVRGLVKEDSLSNSGVVTASDFRGMTGQQRREFIKKNGTVIRQTTSTTQTQVPYSSLNNEEQREADSQVATDPNNVVEIDGTTYGGNTKESAKEGWNASTTYAETPGAYKYHTIYNKINPDAVSVVPTNNTLSDIAQAAYAFENVKITSSDPQIQAQLAKDVASYNNKHTDSKMREAYKNAWLQGIRQKLNSAYAQGKITREEAVRLYQEALRVAEERNRQTTVESSTVKEETTTAVNPPKEETTKPTTKESTTKETTTERDTTPTVSEEKTNNEVDPNLSVDIPDSDFIIVDENYSGENTKYTAGLTLDDIEEYVNSSSDKTLKR